MLFPFSPLNPETCYETTIFLFVISLSLVFSSCDDDEKSKADKLVGTWHSTRIEFYECRIGLLNHVIEDGQCGAAPCLIIQINSDNTFTATDNLDVSVTRDGVITITDDRIILGFTGTTETVTFDYTVSSSKLTIDGDVDDCVLLGEFDKQ